MKYLNKQLICSLKHRKCKMFYESEGEEINRISLKILVHIRDLLFYPFVFKGRDNI